MLAAVLGATGSLTRARPLLALPQHVGVSAPVVQRRTYLHWTPATPEDHALPVETMPKNMSEVMKRNPRELNFFENYWYWRVRAESSLLDTDTLPKKSYKQLARDMGLQMVTEKTEHMCALLELYEYTKHSHFFGPFGTVKEPVIIPSFNSVRQVTCTGSTGDEEHAPLFFWCREGFLYRCGECDQVFMHARVRYSLPDGEEPFPVDAEVSDVFDIDLIEKNNIIYNSGDYITWPIGHEVYKERYLQGLLDNRPPPNAAEMLELRARDHPW